MLTFTEEILNGKLHFCAVLLSFETSCCNLNVWGLVPIFSIYVSSLRYFVYTELQYSCEKKILNITHHRKWISNFLHTVLKSFMITARVRLSQFKKILITESGARWSSNCANFWQIFLQEICLISTAQIVKIAKIHKGFL